LGDEDRSFVGPCVVVAVEHGHGAPLKAQVERAAYTSLEYTAFPHLVIGNCQACSGVLIGGLSLASATSKDAAQRCPRGVISAHAMDPDAWRGR
jgi:hypothetical protein